MTVSTSTRKYRPSNVPFAPATVTEALDFFASPFLSSMQSEDVVRCLSALYADDDARRDYINPALLDPVLLTLADAGWMLYCPDDFHVWRLNDPVAAVRFDPSDPAGAVWLRSDRKALSVTDWPVIRPVFEGVR